MAREACRNFALVHDKDPSGSVMASRSHTAQEGQIWLGTSESMTKTELQHIQKNWHERSPEGYYDTGTVAGRCDEAIAAVPGLLQVASSELGHQRLRSLALDKSHRATA